MGPDLPVFYSPVQPCLKFSGVIILSVYYLYIACDETVRKLYFTRKRPDMYFLTKSGLGDFINRKAA